MRTLLEIIDNNTTYNLDDCLILKFDQCFTRVTSINSLTFNWSVAPTVNDGHDVEYRWSYDGIKWSAWEQYQLNEGPILWTSNITSIIDSGKDFFLEFKFVRRGTNGIPMSLLSADLNYDQAEKDDSGELPAPTGPCSASSASVINFCSGINMNCDPNLAYRPYDSMGSAIQLYHGLTDTVSEMFGHCVRYFRVDPEENSRDVVLKEYSVHSVADVKDIKVLIPDNELPETSFNYVPFDMDFQDGFEIQITKNHFEVVFGQGKRPQEKDFLYFPLLDRLYEVHSSYLPREFMGEQSYYKVMLYKWQDHVATLKKNPEVEAYLDNLTENFQETLQEEIDEEYERVVKEPHYKTISIGSYDHIRSTINDKLIIQDSQIENYYTVVSKYYYDLKTVPLDEVALSYKLSLNRTDTDNSAITFWINTGATGPESFPILIGSTGSTSLSGIDMSIGFSGPTGSVVSQNVTVNIDSDTYVFDNIPNIQGNWHAIVLNHMNEFGQLNLNIWSILPLSEKSNQLKLEYSENIAINKSALITPVNFHIKGAPFNLSNIRVWDCSIEEEKQPIVLNQYIVRETEKTLLIDNCVPPLRMIRQPMK